MFYDTIIDDSLAPLGTFPRRERLKNRRDSRCQKLRKWRRSFWSPVATRSWLDTSLESTTYKKNYRQIYHRRLRMYWGKKKKRSLQSRLNPVSDEHMRFHVRTFQQKIQTDQTSKSLTSRRQQQSRHENESPKILLIGVNWIGRDEQNQGRNSKGFQVDRDGQWEKKRKTHLKFLPSSNKKWAEDCISTVFKEELLELNMNSEVSFIVLRRIIRKYNSSQKSVDSRNRDSYIALRLIRERTGTGETRQSVKLGHEEYHDTSDRSV